MRLFRISKAQFARDLTGEGARIAGGRWNRKGVAVVYAAESLAIATLEAVVHTPLDQQPADLQAVEIDLPDGLALAAVEEAQLPDDWRGYPPPDVLADIGTDWAWAGRTVGLKVPTAVLPWGGGWNYLLNPAHADFGEIAVVDVVDYEFDPRIFER